MVDYMVISYSEPGKYLTFKTLEEAKKYIAGAMAWDRERDFPCDYALFKRERIE